MSKLPIWNKEYKTHIMTISFHFHKKNKLLCTDMILHYVIKFVSELRSSVVFSGFSVFSTNKTDCHNNPDILLKVALNIISLKPFDDGECAVFSLPFIEYIMHSINWNSFFNPCIILWVVSYISWSLYLVGCKFMFSDINFFLTFSLPYDGYYKNASCGLISISNLRFYLHYIYAVLLFLYNCCCLFCTLVWSSTIS